MIAAHSFLVLGKFPTLNDLLTEHGVSPFVYDRTKKRCENMVGAAVRQYKVPAFKHASVAYRLLEKNKRRDPSNVAAAAIKFIEDALVRACVLPGDGWSVIRAYNVEWTQEEFWGVYVTIEGEVCDEPRERIFKQKLQEEAKKLGGKKRARAGAVSVPERPKPVRKATKPRG